LGIGDWGLGIGDWAHYKNSKKNIIKKKNYNIIIITYNNYNNIKINKK
jgi:hypothetical protein